MGLDVYLYRYNRTPDEVDRLEVEWEKRLNALHTEVFGPGGWEKASESQKDEYSRRSDALREASKLDDDGLPEGSREKIEIDSAVHPQHMFKIGYLRSSYNDGGIDRILRDRIGLNMKDIFNPDDGYVVTVDWPEALKRAREVRDDFSRYCRDNGDYRVIEAHANPFIPPNELPDDANKALKLFQAQRNRRNEEVAALSARHDLHDYEKERLSGSAYGCHDGDFFFGDAAFTVEGLVPGSKPNIMTGRAESVMYVIGRYRTGKNVGDGMAWYREALEITVEMCEWVLSQPSPEKYLLHWSG